MGYLPHRLEFDTLRKANLRREPDFKDAKGNRIKHEEWTHERWMLAVFGELGEAANEIKKYLRGDYTEEEFKVKVGREFADVLTYLDLLAHKCGVRLDDALIEKFNEVSVRVGSNIRIDHEDWHYAEAPKKTSDHEMEHK